MNQLSKRLSGFATGQTARQFDTKWLQYGTTTGVLSVVESVPDSQGNWLKQQTALATGHQMILGMHSLFHGWVQFQPPPRREQLHAWAPGVAMLPCPTDWENPQEALKFPILVNQHGPLWLTLTANIPLTGMLNFFSRLGVEPEGRVGRLPKVKLAPSRVVMLRDWPGKVFYDLVFEIIGWVGEDQVHLGPRVTPPPVLTAQALVNPPPPVQPALTTQSTVAISPPSNPPTAAPTAAATLAASIDVPPWDVPQPQPLPPVTPSAVPPSPASAPAAHDPFEIFRRS
jgi:hypothetical protein